MFGSYQGCIICAILPSGMGARGVSSEFPVFQLRCGRILRELNQIFIAYLFKGGQEQSFFLQKLLFTAFLVTILKILTYALVSTWSLVSSGYEHVPQLMQPCWIKLSKVKVSDKTYLCVNFASSGREFCFLDSKEMCSCVSHPVILSFVEVLFTM